MGVLAQTSYGSDPMKKKLPLPDLPESEWCDFRQDYESGMTLKAISEKYICDPRTVKRCLFLNNGSKRLGRQSAPTVLTPYISRIAALWENYDHDTGICRRSREITEELRKFGYSGSERTVRNYLRNHYYLVKPV